LGKISLCIAAGGFVILALLLYFKVVEGRAAIVLTILTAGFEAGTAGALADWFAVRALFREIPIPIMRKHTNIIVKNRKRITDGIVDMVVNSWLSIESLEKRLADFSVSEEIISHLEKPGGRESGTTFIREVLLFFAPELDSSKLVEFLEEVIKGQIKAPKLVSNIGEHVQKYIQRGEYQPLLRNLLESVEKSIADPRFTSFISKELEKLFQMYGKKGVVKKFGIWIGEKVHFIDYDKLTEVLVRYAQRIIKDAKENPTSTLRLRVEKEIKDFGNGLASNDPKYNEFMKTLIENADLKEFILQTLQRFKGTVLEQLKNNDTALMKIVAGYLDKAMVTFRSDEKVKIRQEVDIWIREKLRAFIEKKYCSIGDIVRENIEKLNDNALVNQIESKVGDELQYIRLNGAIIGGLAGLLFGLIRTFALS